MLKDSVNCVWCCITLQFMFQCSRQLQFPEPGCRLTICPSFGKNTALCFGRQLCLKNHADYWDEVCLCPRCKELVLATVRAFFDLINPETRQVRTTNMFSKINLFWEEIWREKRDVIAPEPRGNTSWNITSTNTCRLFFKLSIMFLLVHRKPREETVSTEPSLHQTPCQGGGRHSRHLHLHLRWQLTTERLKYTEKFRAAAIIFIHDCSLN